MKYSVTVGVELIDGIANVTVGQDKKDEELSFQQMAHILVGGISLLTKLVERESGQKDYELMSEVISHLNSEFISLTSFSNATNVRKENNKVL